MPNIIVINKTERLPTLEILGVEYPYDVSDRAVMDKLVAIGQDIAHDRSTDEVVERCRSFVTIMFCGDETPAQKIAEVYEGSAVLWMDALAQFTPFMQSPKIKALIDQTNELKRAADRSRK